MSHFLSDAYRETITLKQHVYTEILNSERHHLCMSKANININDVIVLQSEHDHMLNAQHPETAKNTWTIITTKESYQMGGKTLCIYGFIKLEALPNKLVEMANRYYELNAELVKEQIETIDLKMNAF
jgi:hypothetical protein